MNIGGIENGIVIDHIPAGRGMELYRDLGLDALNSEIVLIKNASSKKYGKKDVLKLSEVIDISYEILGYIDPRITVNFIENGVNVKKVSPTLPEKLTNIIFCKNPRCISSVEQELPHVFKLTDREKAVYRCIYCEMKAKRRS